MAHTPGYSMKGTHNGVLPVQPDLVIRMDRQVDQRTAAESLHTTKPLHSQLVTADSNAAIWETSLNQT